MLEGLSKEINALEDASQEVNGIAKEDAEEELQFLLDALQPAVQEPAESRQSTLRRECSVEHDRIPSSDLKQPHTVAVVALWGKLSTLAVMALQAFRDQSDCNPGIPPQMKP